MENEKYVPLEKRTKKEKKRHYAMQRNDWNGVVPVTRVIPNRKKRAVRQEKHRPEPDMD